MLPVESRNKPVKGHRFGIRHMGLGKSLIGIPQLVESARQATFYIE
jgi:hypothetical protein